MRRPRAGLTAILALLLGLALPAPAHATYDPLGSGATQLRLDKSFLSLLKRNGVQLAASEPARLKAGTVTFPVSGGKFDSTGARGAIDHEGALVFRAGSRSVPLRSLQLKTTQRRAPLSAKAGGGQLKLASAARLSVARAGFGDRVRIGGLALSAKLAGRLAKKLRLRDVFADGQPLGSITTIANPVTVALEGTGKAALTLDPAIEAKLGSLFVAVNPIFPAEHIGAPFQLPIFGGALAPDASSGRLETSGSLELLQLGGGQVFWAEPWLDLTARALSVEANIQPSPPYAGKVGRVEIATLDLAAAQRAADGGARTISVSGATLLLAAQAAVAFNEAFAEGKDVFRAGEPLGSLSFVARGE